MNLKSYYTEEVCAKIFNAIEEPNWRIWKILDEDGRCLQNKRLINNPKQLSAFIKNSKNPQKLYVSISTFLNPHKNHGWIANQKQVIDGRYHYPKPGYVTADCILLDSYFFVDIDEQAHKKAKQVLRILKEEPLLRLYSMQFSGSKGVHLIYKMKSIGTFRSPQERLKKLKFFKTLISNKLSKILDEVHLNITRDNFRVYAAPWSIKPNLKIVTPIININQLLHYLPEAIEAQADDPKVATAKGNTLATQNYSGGMRDGLSSHYTYYAVPNFVKGLKNNYVPFIKVHKKNRKRLNLEELKKTLSTIYLYEEENYYWIVSFKCFQKPKLLKIMRKLKASNFNEFRYRYNMFRYTNSIGVNEQQVQPAVKLIDIIENKDNYRISKEHYDFFRNNKSSLQTYEVTEVA